MPFFERALTLIAESRREDGAVSRRWFYSTPDALATVTAAGYFNSVRKKLTVGDLIECSVGIGGTPVTITLRLVAVPGTGNVTVTKTQDVV